MIPNREIKFRAWDGEEMTYSEKPTVDKSVCIKYGKVCLVEKYFNDASDEYAEMVISSELMQFTGLKDRNGVEVYEGDIISYDNDIQDDDRFIVEWMEDYPGFVSLSYGMGIGEFETDSIEVIGNIYEHPDLLEGGE